MFWNLSKIKEISKMRELERKLKILKTYSISSKTTETDTIKGVVLVKTSHFEDDINSMFVSEKLSYLNHLLGIETGDSFFNKFKINMVFDNSYLFSSELYVETFENFLKELIKEKIEQLGSEINVIKRNR